MSSYKRNALSDRMYFQAFSRSDGDINSVSMKEFLSCDLEPQLQSGDFFWRELLDFYIHYHSYFKKKKDPVFHKSSYITLDDVQEILTFGGANPDLLDKSGFNLSLYLISIAFEYRSDSKLHISRFQVSDILAISKNPAICANSGQNFLWYLTNRSFTLMDPDAALLPLINQYKIDPKTVHLGDDDLLDKALQTNCDELIGFYINQQLDLFAHPRLHNFLFTPVYNSDESKRVYQKLLTQQDPFDKLLYTQGYNKGQKTDSLMDSWFSFLKSNSKDASCKNILLTLKLITQNKVKIKPSNVKKAIVFCEKMLKFNQTLYENQNANKVCQEALVALEKSILEKNIKTPMSLDVKKSSKAKHSAIELKELKTSTKKYKI